MTVDGSRVRFVARFLGQTLAYTYEVRAWERGERLVMATAEGPFPMETTYAWADAGEDVTRMTLRNRGAPSGLASVAAPVVARSHAARERRRPRPAESSARARMMRAWPTTRIWPTASAS